MFCGDINIRLPRPLRHLAKGAILFCLLYPGTTWGQKVEQPRPDQPRSIGEAIQRVVNSENALIARLSTYHPLVEIYIQNENADPKLGSVPKNDEYFLAKLDSSSGLKANSLLPADNLLKIVSGAFKFPFAMKYMQDAFAAMILVDKESFNTNKYEFQYLRQEFLGGVRCLVFDIRPHENFDGFRGRIWVEDREYTIVRFNGVNGALPSPFGHRFFFHFDSWRLNMAPGLWLPAFVYTEESDFPYGFASLRKLRLKGQVRLWGYDLKHAGRQEQFTDIVVDDPGVRDRTEVEQRSPVWSQRSWEQQAEDNVLERLEKAGLLAAEGEVDKVLQTVVRNLEITNNLELDPEVRCRVLLTSPFESFTLGRTIVLSRGLIDVLPDEASLATMLAHELSHIVLGQRPIDTKYSFADRMMVEDADILGNFRFHRDRAEEAAADQKAIELLKHSPYADKLSNAGLFLKAVQNRAKPLPNLIRPHLGDRLAKGSEILRFAEVMSSAPNLQMERTDQIAALPLGGRIKVNPWNDQIEMIKAKPTALRSAREKMPFEVTPFMIDLSYQQNSKNASLSDLQKATK